MTQRKILIVDDELSVRKSLEEWFLEDGFAVETAEDGNAALTKMHSGPYDIIVVDLKMPGMDGITLQKRVREIDPKAALVILTAYASVDTAVEALKLGAFDYVTKPVDPDELSNLVRNALRQRELEEENVRLKEKVSELAPATPIIGESSEMQHVLEMVRTVAETDSTVPPRLATTRAPESRATLPSRPVPTVGDSVFRSGTAWRCMFDPMSARLASSCSRNGIKAAAGLTICMGARSR